MGSLGIRATAAKSCPVSRPRSPFYEKVYAVAGALTAEAKRCMPAPRRLRWMASDVIDAEFALRSCK